MTTQQKSDFAQAVDAFAGSLVSLHHCEVDVSDQVIEAIRKYWMTKGSCSPLGVIYNGVRQANAATAMRGLKECRKEDAINKVINSFCGVTLKKDLDGNPELNKDGFVTIIKDRAKSDKRLKETLLIESQTGFDPSNTEHVSALNLALTKYLCDRGGDIFGKVKKAKSEDKTAQEKLEAEIVKLERMIAAMNNIEGVGQSDKKIRIFSTLLAKGVITASDFAALTM